MERLVMFLRRQRVRVPQVQKQKCEDKKSHLKMS